MVDSVDFDSIFRVVEKGVMSDVFDEPDVKDFNAFSYGDYELLGHGKKTNGECGKFYGLKGCLNVGLHGNTLGGKDYSGMVYARPALHSCNNPRCPVCFKFGFAVRGADRAEQRLNIISLEFGVNKSHNCEIEHIIASAPLTDWHLDFDALIKKCYHVLKSRGVHGGCVIFHPFRYNKFVGWHYSPHFHCVGFISGGFDRCRACKSSGITCSGVSKCDGMKKRVVKGFKHDDWVVKVGEKRKSIFGTLWYQLNHAGLVISKPRFNVVRWFGSCCRTKAKVIYAKHRRKCPLCGNDTYGVVYHGSKIIVKDHNDPKFRSELLMDFREDGVVVWSFGKDPSGRSR